MDSELQRLRGNRFHHRSGGLFGFHSTGYVRPRCSYQLGWDEMTAIQAITRFSGVGIRSTCGLVTDKLVMPALCSTATATVTSTTLSAARLPTSTGTRTWWSRQPDRPLLFYATISGRIVAETQSPRAMSVLGPALIFRPVRFLGQQQPLQAT